MTGMIHVGNGQYVNKAGFITMIVVFGLIVVAGVLWLVMSISASQATNIPAQQRDIQQSRINDQYGMTP